MAKRIPINLGKAIKRHNPLLQNIVKSSGKRRKLLLLHAPRSFYSTVQTLFRNILRGVIPTPYNFKNNLLKRVVNSKTPQRVIQQSGSGIGAILKTVIPIVASILPQLFKK